MARLEVRDTERLKRAMEEFRLLAEKTVEIARDSQVRVAAHSDAAGSDATGAKFKEQHDGPARSTQKLVDEIGRSLQDTTDRIRGLHDRLVKTEINAVEASHRIGTVAAGAPSHTPRKR
ncbi:hypothetical protein [Streptomyces sp. NPDC093970]|uniref:hypothetical protein n=1 Tax=Streptomyces sp. NPDC093970 TaxID=3155076 RepID=UPI003419D902